MTDQRPDAPFAKQPVRGHVTIHQPLPPSERPTPSPPQAEDSRSVALTGDVCIHRFDLPPSEREIEVLTYRGAVFLPHVVGSDRIPNGYTVWAVVPVDNPVAKRYLRVLGTGDTVPAESLATHDYLNTYHQGPWVWHVFVTKET